jgi:SAM-dependent methyltransferase
MTTGRTGSSERTGGLRRLLGIAGVYSLFQSAVGAARAKRWLAGSFWRVPSGGKVVEVGCGPGDVVPFLPPDAEYVGFDPSPRYIARARERFAARPRTTFLPGVAAELAAREELHDADVVLCNGVLHHLDDREAAEVLQLARTILKPGGSFRGSEPCFVAKQSRLSRRIMELDRGGHIRTEAAWTALIGEVFPVHRAIVKRGLIRLPYVHVLLEGTAKLRDRAEG